MTTSAILEAFFARQPIFDANGKAMAYELLYRPTPGAIAATGTVDMSAHVAVDSMLGMDLHAATDGLPAFFNVTRSLLLSGLFDALDPARLVIEILESIEPDDEVVSACHRLKDIGYKLALDDYEDEDARAVLMPLADIVKLDVLERPIDRAVAMAEAMRNSGLSVVAERVETRDIHDACVRGGFDLFQGYFYRRPEIVRQPDLKPAQVLIVEAMNLVQDDRVPDRRIGSFFKSDPTLAFKVVRMANVAPMGIRTIESVEHAVAIVGRSAIFRWLGLLLLTSFDRSTGIQQELLREALVRARLCELLADAAGVRPAGPLFLVGLFSRIEALLGIPAASIVDQVNVPASVRDALLERTGPYAPLLFLAEAYEDGRWSEVVTRANTSAMDPARIPAAFRDALDWASTVSRKL